ncbi:integrase, catalytic region, zinc finger, CCHC-type containing protein [Tanacetum coccineum]
MYNPQRASPPPNQSSPISAFNLDDDSFKPLWASVSQPSQYTEGPSQPVEDDSPVEKVETVKPKRKYTRRRQPIKKSDKEFVEQWTIEERHQSGACDTTIYQEAEIDYHAIFNAAFALTDCWKILKDHPKWKKVAPMGRERAKKKASSSGARSETSVASDPSLVDALLSKFTMAATPFFRRGRNLPLTLTKNVRISTTTKWEEDIKYYNEDHEHLTGRALSTALLSKKKIKERWNLDY